MENDLVKLVRLDTEVNKLKLEIEDIEKTLDNLDTQIQKVEDIDPDLANIYAETYNELDLKRIGLELKKNKLEHELLLIEYEHAIAE